MDCTTALVRGDSDEFTDGKVHPGLSSALPEKDKAFVAVLYPCQQGSDGQRARGRRLTAALRSSEELDQVVLSAP
ncbi:MAG: hypothetical protein JOY80_06915 [Candidatus Dormibacteraeota bacterium]|nr:hypothetical protein [Candidatus Dormibacteraeota bacterium]